LGALTFTHLATVPTRCVLGEGPVWDGRIGALWQTDIQSAELLRIDWPDLTVTRFALPERLGSLALTPDSGRLLCAFASGFAWYEPAGGIIEWLHRTEPDYRGLRMNDGRVDRQGRFWCGSMVEREEDAPGEGGTLYRLDPANLAAPRAMASGISISNAICFSPAGDRCYFADTLEQAIRAYPLDPLTGTLGQAQIFARLGGTAWPDGADVDAEGRVWNAEWGTGRVTVYAPDGGVIDRLDLPVTQSTCVAFGGPELALLFVTSAREGLSPEELSAQPEAGNTMIFRTSARGLPATVFGG
jgi:L-arabinonolactonase